MLCRGCGCRLTPIYPGEQYHPACNPEPITWWDMLEALDYWCERARRRESARDPN